MKKILLITAFFGALQATPILSKDRQSQLPGHYLKQEIRPTKIKQTQAVLLNKILSVFIGAWFIVCILAVIFYKKNNYTIIKLEKKEENDLLDEFAILESEQENLTGPINEKDYTIIKLEKKQVIDLLYDSAIKKKQEGDFSGAIKDYNIAIKKCFKKDGSLVEYVPNFYIGNLYYSKAVTQGSQKDFAGAISSYDEVIKNCLNEEGYIPLGRISSATMGDTYYFKGSCLEQQGKLEEAITCYRASLRFYGKLLHREDIGYANHQLGVCLEKQGKCEEAIACYQEVIKLFHREKAESESEDRFEGEPENFEDEDNDRAVVGGAHGEIGNCLVKQGKWEEAIASYEKGLETFSLIHNEDKRDKPIEEINQKIRECQAKLQSTN